MAKSFILVAGLFSFVFFHSEVSAVTAKPQESLYSPYGIWEHPKGKTRVRIQQCNDHLCGTIIWLKKPLRNGKPKVDRKNKVADLRTRRVIGLDVFEDMTFDPKRQYWKGNIYNPDDGGEYNGYISILSPTEAKIEGCWLIFCKTQIWTRVESRNKEAKLEK